MNLELRRKCSKLQDSNKSLHDIILQNDHNDGCFGEVVNQIQMQLHVLSNNTLDREQIHEWF